MGGDEMAAKWELVLLAIQPRWRPEVAARDGWLQALEIARFMTWVAASTAILGRVAVEAATHVLVPQLAHGVSRSPRTVRESACRRSPAKGAPALRVEERITTCRPQRRQHQQLVSERKADHRRLRVADLDTKCGRAISRER